MWQKFLLSVLLLPAFHTGYAQKSLCTDPVAADSAITHIQRSYSYTSEAWQLACDSLLAQCPDLDQVWQMKAMPNIKLGNWEKAYGPLSHAVALNPEQWLSYQAFLKCIFSKDYEGALVDFEACEKLIKGAGVMDHSFDFFRGLSYLCLGDLPNATAFLKKDVDAQVKSRGAGNEHFVLLLYWGICLFKDGKVLEAELTFRKSLAIYPQYPETNFYLGSVYAKTGKTILAKAYYKKSRQYLNEGYTSGEDQEPYVHYPFAIGQSEIDEALKDLE